MEDAKGKDGYSTKDLMALFGEVREDEEGHTFIVTDREDEYDERLRYPEDD